MRRMLGALEERFTGGPLDDAHRDENLGRLQLLLVVAFIVGALVISSLLSSTNRAPRVLNEEEFAPLVDAVHVTSESRRIEITGSGAVRSQVTVQLVPQVEGRVSWLTQSMQTGGSFAKDEVLFRIEAADYELEVERLRAEVASAQTNLQLEEAEGRAATREWEEINPGEPVPDLVARRPQIRDKGAALSAAQARLAVAQLDLNRTSFSLPFDGRVVTSNIDLGQFVAVRQSYGTAYPIDGLEVAVPLADRDLKWLQPFEAVQAVVRTSYLGIEREFSVTASRIAAELDDQTRFAAVIVSLKPAADGPDTSKASTSVVLVPGVFVSVTFIGAELNNVFSVPTAAVQESGKIWTIVDGRLKEATPEIVQVGPKTTLLRGLNAGDKILTSNLSGAVEGMAVRTGSDQTEQQ